MGLFIVIIFLSISGFLCVAIIKHVRKQTASTNEVSANIENIDKTQKIQQEFEKDEKAEVFLHTFYANILEFSQNANNIGSMLYDGELDFCDSFIKNKLLDFMQDVFDNADYDVFDPEKTFEESATEIAQVLGANIIQFLAKSYVLKLDRFCEIPKTTLEECCEQFKTLINSKKVSLKSRAELFYFWYDKTPDQDIYSAYSNFLAVYDAILNTPAVSQPTKITETTAEITEITENAPEIMENTAEIMENTKIVEETPKIIEQPTENTIKKVVPKKIRR